MYRRTQGLEVHCEIVGEGMPVVLRDEMLVGFESGDPEFRARIRGDAASYALSFDVDAAPVAFQKPALIVTGRQDCLVGYRDAWRLLKDYPRCTFAVLDMAGHGLQIEQAALFSALVHEWLDRVQDSLSADRARAAATAKP